MRKKKLIVSVIAASVVIASINIFPGALGLGKVERGGDRQDRLPSA